MSAPNILVVDSDEGFGFMLQEGLNNTGQYNASWVQAGSDALQAIVEENFELVIIDIGLSDMKPNKLVQGIRHARSDTKIMMIPMIGQDLPEYLQKLEVDGVLPKPFFVGDLPDLVNQALGRVPQVRKPAPQVAKTEAPLPEAPGEDITEPEIVDTPSDIVGNLNIPVVPQETIRFLRSNEQEILRHLNDLNREVRAEAILLIAGANLIAQSGMLAREQCEELALLVAQSAEAASQAARFLGERAGRFSQSLHEGGAYRLYSLTLGEGILLTLALSTNVPLGMIRHQCRQISETLSKYII